MAFPMVDRHSLVGLRRMMNVMVVVASEAVQSIYSGYSAVMEMESVDRDVFGEEGRVCADVSTLVEVVD